MRIVEELKTKVMITLAVSVFISFQAMAESRTLQAFGFPLSGNQVIKNIVNLGTVKDRLVVAGLVGDKTRQYEDEEKKCLLFSIYKGAVNTLAEIGGDCSDSNPLPVHLRGLKYQTDGNSILVSVETGLARRDLWLTDGTIENTISIKDDFDQNGNDFLIKGKIYSSVVTSYEAQRSALYVRDGQRYEQLLESGGVVMPFLQTDLVVIQSGLNLYISDGTVAGTRLIFEGNLSMPQWNNQYVVGEDRVGTYSFNVSVSDGTDGATLMVMPNLPVITDGTVEGTFAINPEELVPDCDKSLTKKNGIFQIGNALFYTRCDGSGGRDLVSYSLVSKIISKVASLPDTENVVFGDYTGEWMDKRHLGRLFIFNQKSPDGSLSLWRTNGTSAGTYKISDLNVPDYEYGNLKELSTLLESNGHLYLVGYNGTLWVSDGSQSGTYQIPKVWTDIYGFSPSIATAEGITRTQHNDYLINEANFKELSSAEGSISLAIHNPLRGKEAAMVLLSYSGNPQDYSGGQIRTMESDSSYIFGLAGRAGYFDFYYIDKDLCPSDPDKQTPGFCGCGVEEQQLEVYKDPSSNLNAAVCQTEQGNALLNLESAPAPKAELKTSELIISFPDNLLEKLAANLDLASGDGSLIVSDNKQISKKVKTKLNLRILQIADGKYKTLKFKKLKNGKFKTKLPKGASRNTVFAYEYGFNAISKKGHNTLFTVDSLKRGKIEGKKKQK